MAHLESLPLHENDWKDLAGSDQVCNAVDGGAGHLVSRLVSPCVREQVTRCMRDAVGVVCAPKGGSFS